MRIWKTLLSLVILISALSLSAFSQKQKGIPKVGFEEYRLGNGLRVILHQDNSIPVAAVNVWYHVGSKDEGPGKKGFAHLFEHLMFQGSKNYNANYYIPLEEAGGGPINGITTQDTTNFFEVIPSNFLELALFLEADRMGGLAETITQKKLEIQRNVVINERLRNFDNQPYGTWLENAYQKMYPPGHPYRWHPIGSIEDLSSATLNDVKRFFRKYYVPNNAILSISGDFNMKQTKDWIEKYFGPLDKGKQIKRPIPTPAKMKGEKRLIVEDSVSLPRLFFGWHMPPRYSKGEAELEMLARILTYGRSSRLKRKLVYQKKLVQNVAFVKISRELGGQFFLLVIPQKDKSLDQIEKEINLEIELLKTQPPAEEEITRALNRIESDKIFDLQTNLIRGDLLADYAVFLGKPAFINKDINRFRRISAADLQKAAKKYLSGNRLVMSYIPRSEAPDLGSPAKKKASGKENLEIKKPSDKYLAEQAANLPEAGPNPTLSLPPVEKTKLSNGLEVWLVKRDKLPIISMNMVIKAGVTSEPEPKAGVAWLTSQLLRSGTKNLSATELSESMQMLGAILRSSVRWDATTIETQTLSKNFKPVLTLFSDAIVNPLFPEKELENLRDRRINRIIQQRSVPREMAKRVFFPVLYGENPYNRQLFGTEKGLANISSDDVRKFYAQSYRPNDSVLIVVGDINRNTLVAELEEAFSDWNPRPSAPHRNIKIPSQVEKSRIYLVDKPGAAQSTIFFGQIAAPRNSPDFIPMTVLNSILGFGLNSRISMNLRETKGYTYEAGSDFTFYKNAGHFTAWADVRTEVTKESVAEIVKELEGIAGSKPLTKKELEYSKQSLIRRFPGKFESTRQIAFYLSEAAVYDLPGNYFESYIQKVDSVTANEINQVADRYIPFNKMAIIIVGDRTAIEPELKKMRYEIQIVKP
ncbi:MAG: insulinase family protein [Pyrinomonadaceae bacterium]|nr:insulinase family protein [Pyrinomonadaceae bacterium]